MKPISIHASTWEATQCICATKSEMQYFNSRLYMRGNRGHICIVIVNGNFNSRLCTRGDIDFNTHLLCKRYFNSRLYTRGDVSHSIVLPVVEDILIHTSTWEATSVAESNSFVPIYFNSRLCMRGNPVPFSLRYSRFISILASTWEATVRWS